MQSKHLPCISRCSLCGHRLSSVGFVLFVCVSVCVAVWGRGGVYHSARGLQPKIEMMLMTERGLKWSNTFLVLTEQSHCSNECDCVMTHLLTTAVFVGLRGSSGASGLFWFTVRKRGSGKYLCFLLHSLIIPPFILLVFWTLHFPLAKLIHKVKESLYFFGIINLKMKWGWGKLQVRCWKICAALMLCPQSWLGISVASLLFLLEQNKEVRALFSRCEMECLLSVDCTQFIEGKSAVTYVKDWFSFELFF